MQIKTANPWIHVRERDTTLPISFSDWTNVHYGAY